MLKIQSAVAAVGARPRNQASGGDFLNSGGLSISDRLREGLRKIVSADLISHERPPVLKILFSRLVRRLSIGQTEEKRSSEQWQRTGGVTKGALI